MSKGHFINGQWISGSGAEFFSINPATGESIWQGSAAGAAEIDAAIHSARAAAEDWASRFVEQRAEHLQRFGQQLQRNRIQFTEAISRSTGKPLWEADTETQSVLNKIAISIDAQQQRRTDASRQTSDSTSWTRYKPYGVVAVLGPFNFPAHLPNGHIMPALLAGNTIIFKPSELTPLVGEFVATLWQEAGLPPGVLNLVQGARETGKFLVEHRKIDGVFFTGSFEAGRAINRALADHPGKIAALEMGGNNPLVIHQVSNLEAAAYWTIQSAYLTSGQRCSCARRLILVDGDSTGPFIERLASMIQQIAIGPYTSRPEPFMGPVISDDAATKILAAQENLIRKGGRPIIAARHFGLRPAFLTPGLIDVTDVRERPDEEIFGPLLQIIRVRDFDEAIAEANHTRFGLAAGLFSDDRKLWDEFYSRIRAGVVNWNRPLTGASSSLPFGGAGDSGNHRPSAYFAADYCSWPVASMECEKLTLPSQFTPGLPPAIQQPA